MKSLLRRRGLLEVIAFLLLGFFTTSSETLGAPAADVQKLQNSTNGLAIRVITTNTLTSAQEPIFLSISMKNLGHTNISFGVNRYNAFAIFTPHIVTFDGKAVPLTAKGKERLDSMQSVVSGERITLKPGEEFSHIVPDSLKDFYDLVPNTKYIIYVTARFEAIAHGELKQHTDTNGNFKWNDYFEPLVKGKKLQTYLISNQVEISIRGAN